MLACRKGCNKAASQKNSCKLLLLRWDPQESGMMTGVAGKRLRCHIQSASPPRLPRCLAGTEGLLQGTIQHRSVGQTLWITFSSTYSLPTRSLRRLASKPNQRSEVSWVGNTITRTESHWGSNWGSQNQLTSSYCLSLRSNSVNKLHSLLPVTKSVYYI